MTSPQRLRLNLFSELRKRQSVLRSVTNVALSKLRLELSPGAQILDAGGPTTTCWDSLTLPHSHQRFNVDLGLERHPDVRADLDRLWPFADGAFDGVVSFYVLEHVKRPHVFFEESYRCLSDGGMLVLTTVLAFPKHASPNDYFRFTDDALIHLSWEVGFASPKIVPLLQGPAQTLVGMGSTWLFFPVVRYVSFIISHLLDKLLNRLPGVGGNWCVGYILTATKNPETMRERR